LSPRPQLEVAVVVPVEVQGSIPRTATARAYLGPCCEAAEVRAARFVCSPTWLALCLTVGLAVGRVPRGHCVVAEIITREVSGKPDIW
jgi:hypothetical protein